MNARNSMAGNYKPIYFHIVINICVFDLCFVAKAEGRAWGKTSPAWWPPLLHPPECGRRPRLGEVRGRGCHLGRQSGKSFFFFFTKLSVAQWYKIPVGLLPQQKINGGCFDVTNAHITLVTLYFHFKSEPFKVLFLILLPSNPENIIIL